MRIPWKAKSSAFAVLEHVGDRPLWFAQKFVTRRSHVRVDAVTKSWQFHHDQLTKYHAKRIVEFGAGKNLIQNLFLSPLGLDQTVIDVKPMLDLKQVNLAIDGLRNVGIDLPGHVGSRDELESAYGIRYMAPSDMRRTGFPADSCDAVISTNTLEHIPVPSIEQIWKECRRVLKPGGIVASKIDYSDHYAHTDPRISTLNYLRFTDEDWARYNHENHYQNRLRHRHHINLLTNAGFEIVEEHVGDAQSADGIELRPALLTGDPTDLYLDGFITARKPDVSTG